MKNTNVKNKKISKKAKIFLAVMTAISAFTTFAMPLCASSAPPDVNTAAMDSMVEVVFWAVRIVIVAVGGVPSCIKVVQGQADENPRDRNAGIAGLIVTGVIFGATFAVKALISK
ncbi:MAG: hypothetical protein RR540_00530 [Oscillospiraceae bacterium]